MPSSKKINILVIHPHCVMSDMISFLLESEFNSQVMSCQSKDNAYQLLSNTHFDLVVSSSQMSDGTGEEIFQTMVDCEKILPFILIDKNGRKISPYKNNSIIAAIPEEKTISDLNTIFSKMLSVDTSSKPDEWTEISLAPLVHMSALPEDIFIQLVSGRKLKIFQAGDTITTDDVKRYSRKQVEKLFLKRSAFCWLIKQIDNAVPEILKNPEGVIYIESSPQIAVKEDELPSFAAIPIQEEFMKQLHEKSKEVIAQMKKNKDLVKLLKSFNVNRAQNAFFKSRIDLVCMISCAVSRELGWMSDAMYEKLIYVSYVHDLTLIENPHLAKLQNAAQLSSQPSLTKDEQNLFLQHPILVANIITKDTRAPAEAALIVRQHHEKPNGQGFPDKLTHTRIMPTSAVLQISIDLAQYILSNPGWTMEAYFADSGQQFRGGPFTKISRSLEKIFKSKH